MPSAVDRPASGGGPNRSGCTARLHRCSRPSIWCPAGRPSLPEGELGWIDALQHVLEVAADGGVAFAGEGAQPIHVADPDAPPPRFDHAALAQVVDDPAEIGAADAE